MRFIMPIITIQLAEGRSEAKKQQIAHTIFKYNLTFV